MTQTWSRIYSKKKKKRRAKTFRQSTRPSVWLCLQETKEKSVQLTFDRVVQHFLGVVEVNSEEDPLTENADDQEQHELEHTGKNWVRGTEIFFWLIFDREVYPWARGSPVKCLSCSFFLQGIPLIRDKLPCQAILQIITPSKKWAGEPKCYLLPKLRWIAGQRQPTLQRRARSKHGKTRQLAATSGPQTRCH